MATETQVKSKGGGRSPGYPFIPLQQAILRAKQFWDKEGKNLVPVFAAIKGWGYGEKSSGGKQTVAALKHYGLLMDVGEGDSRKVKLTERALDIVLEPENSPKRTQAIKEAARAPKLYGELLSKWETVPSDHSISAFLLREKDSFNRNAVEDFIKDFRATLSFANISSSDTIPASDGQETNEGGGSLSQLQRASVEHSTRLLGQQSGMLPPDQKAKGKQIGAAIPVTPSCSISILADGEVTQDGLDKLIAYINLIKASFPKSSFDDLAHDAKNS